MQLDVHLASDEVERRVDHEVAGRDEREQAQRQLGCRVPARDAEHPALPQRLGLDLQSLLAPEAELQNVGRIE